MLTWFRWTTLMIALGAIAYLGGRATPWSCMDMTIAAYWVQAIGSIAAIIGAFSIASYQARKNEKVRVEEKKLSDGGHCYSCYVISGEVLNCMQEMLDNYQVTRSQIRQRLIIAKAEEAQNALRILMSKSIPGELFLELILIQREFAPAVADARVQDSFQRINESIIDNTALRIEGAEACKERIFTFWTSTNTPQHPKA